MIDDAKDGRINLILVKDLSHFGRDSVGVGYYTGEVLSAIGCRFIALSDSIDSEQDDSDMLPLLCLLGDSYLKDISRKIRAVLRSKAENGECLMAYVPYGYQKSPENKHRLVVDEYAAGVVRKIYSLRLQKKGFAAIAVSSMTREFCRREATGISKMAMKTQKGPLGSGVMLLLRSSCKMMFISDI